MTKERLEEIKLYFDIAKSLALLAFCVGVVLVFLYCLFERMFPSGLTLSDTFSFLYIAFVFAFIFVVGLVFASYSMIWVVRVVGWLSSQSAKKNDPIGCVKYHSIMTGKLTFVLSVSCLLPFILLPFCSQTRTPAEYWHTIGFFCFIGFFITLFSGVTTSPAASTSEVKKVGFVFVCIFAAFLIFKPPLMNETLASIGIRSVPSDVVVINGTAYSDIQAASDALGIPVTICPFHGTDQMTKDVQVVWHGLGEKSYVRLGINGSGPLIPVDRNGIKLLRGSSSTCTPNIKKNT